MQRRSFLASMLALAAAPAIVRASSLMPIAVLEESVIDTSWASPEAIDLLRQDLEDIIYNVGPFEGDLWASPQGHYFYHKKQWHRIN